MTEELINFRVLEEFLKNNEIPSVKQQPKTFLEIARQPHYENVISNIYAFYFDPHEEHGLGHLFIDSFIECIKEQPPEGKDFLDDFQDFIIDTEYSTENGGRIDLFIYNDEQAIVIENKIYHNLANDLNDYWKTAKKNSRKDSDIVGVLLTLTKHTASLNSQFVNILHLDFLQKVMANIGNHFMKASDKYVTFLKDLYQNIENMSTKVLPNEEFSFYIKNQDKINDLVKFNEQVFKHVKTQVVNAGNSIEGFEVISAKENSYRWFNYRYIKKNKNDNIMFTIHFGKLLTTEKVLRFSIEVKGNELKNYFRKKNEIDELVSMRYPELTVPSDAQTGEGWKYLAQKKYELSDEDLMNLEKFIREKIDEDKFTALFEDILKPLHASV